MKTQNQAHLKDAKLPPQFDPAGIPEAGEESGFESFRRVVLHEPALQQQLIGISECDAFIERTVQLGEERGFRFIPGDVEAAILAARRAWTERWIA